MSRIVCPICGENDAIQKVSAVVTSGQASGTFAGPTGGLAYVGGRMGVAGGYTTLSGTVRQELSRLLAAPDVPREGGTGCMGFYFAVVWGFAGIVGIFLGLASIVSSFAASDAGQALAFGIKALIFSALPLALAYWVLSSGAREKKSYPARKETWEKLMARWDRLYYCFRDDVVFDPEMQKVVPPRQMNELLEGG